MKTIKNNKNNKERAISEKNPDSTGIDTDADKTKPDENPDITRNDEENTDKPDTSKEVAKPNQYINTKDQVDKLKKETGIAKNRRVIKAVKSSKKQKRKK